MEKAVNYRDLIGSTIWDVITLLPTFPWRVRNFGGVFKEAEVSDFVAVDFDTHKPRKEGEYFSRLHATPGQPLEPSVVRTLSNAPAGRTVGLTSLAYLNPTQKRTHLPLVDIDIKESITPPILDWVKKQIREVLGIERGLLLASGREGSLHFIGVERLLHDEEFVTFVGLCLQCWRHDGKPNLIDPVWLGFCLTPMWHAFEMEDDPYDMSGLRFATLRASSTTKKPGLPTVIDVLD